MKSNLAAIGCMVGSTLLLTGNDAISKLLLQDYAVGQVWGLRGLAAILVLLGYVAARGQWTALRVTNWPGQGLRAGLFVCNSLLIVVSLGLLPLADVVAITYASPIIVAALSVPLLGERVGPHRWGAILVGFCGVVIMTRPAPDVFQVATLVPIAALILTSARDVITRRISRTENSLSILLVSLSAVTLVGLAWAPFGAWRWPDPVAVALFALNGVFQAGAHFLAIEAFRRTEAALVSPYRYTGLLWGALFGLLIWGAVPDLWVTSGALVMLAGGLYLVRREARAARG